MILKFNETIEKILALYKEENGGRGLTFAEIKEKLGLNTKETFLCTDHLLKKRFMQKIGQNDKGRTIYATGVNQDNPFGQLSRNFYKREKELGPGHRLVEFGNKYPTNHALNNANITYFGGSSLNMKGDKDE